MRHLGSSCITVILWQQSVYPIMMALNIFYFESFGILKVGLFLCLVVLYVFELKMGPPSTYIPLLILWFFFTFILLLFDSVKYQSWITIIFTPTLSFFNIFTVHLPVHLTFITSSSLSVIITYVHTYTYMCVCVCTLTAWNSSSERGALWYFYHLHGIVKWHCHCLA